MSRETVVFLLGVLIFFTPHLGIPEVWKFYNYTVVGVLLMIIGYSLRRSAYLRSIETKDGEFETDSFVETVTAVAASDGGETTTE